MNKIKLAFFFPSFETGGAEKAALNLLKELSRERFDLSLVLAEKKGNCLKTLPADIAVVDLKSQGFVDLFLRLLKYFKRENPDIFVSVFPHFSLLAIIAKNFSGANAKIVIIEHSIFSRTAENVRTFFRRFVGRFIFPTLMRIFYSKAAKIISVSKDVANNIKEITNLSDCIKVVYNPIIENSIYNLAEEKIEHPWFKDSKTPVLLAVGRFAKAKDYPTLLYAFAKVQRKKHIKLVVLGDGYERENLEKLCHRLGIAGNVAFLGFQENPYKYIAKACIFALSSKQEGFPTVLIEAMALGLPVVSTDCGSGAKEVIESGRNGFLVPACNSDALSEAIIKLLESPSLREKFSLAGRVKAKDFSVSRGVKEYEKIFFELSK